MKKQLLFILLIIFISISVSRAQTSRKNYTGTWTSGSSWTGGIAPPVTAISSDILIQGYITRNGSLSFAANHSDKAIVINDTLVVTGNMQFFNDAQELRIGPKGVLIVLGNFSATNKIDLSNGGIFVVRGNLTLSNSGQDQYQGAGELFVLGTISGSASAGAANTASGSLTKYPAIYNFVTGATNSLPVKLLNFSANRSNGYTAISWSTANEKDFDYFTVERSTDYKNFVAIGKVKGAGNSNSILKYEFNDYFQFTGDIYYRLKATDFDGTHEYHPIIKFSTSKNESLKLSIFPNPLSDQYFKIQSPFDKGTLIIYNILGKEVFRGEIETDNSFNLKDLFPYNVVDPDESVS